MIKVEEFECRRDLVRARLRRFTRKAFQLLPRLDRPCILDVGCGSGIATIELAKLCDGQIAALDIDEHDLNRLDAKIKEAGLSQRVSTLKCSMLDMKFPNDSFDIIWAEGSIAVIGFGKGLQDWARFLRTNGYLVVHDETGSIDEKLRQITSCGYDIVEYFVLDQDVWWAEYYAPLQKLIQEIRPQCAGEPEALALVDQNQQEIDMFKVSPERYHSTFFIMRKR